MKRGYRRNAAIQFSRYYPELAYFGMQEMYEGALEHIKGIPGAVAGGVDDLGNRIGTGVRNIGGAAISQSYSPGQWGARALGAAGDAGRRAGNMMRKNRRLVGAGALGLGAAGLGAAGYGVYRAYNSPEAKARYRATMAQATRDMNSAAKANNGWK